MKKFTKIALIIAAVFFFIGLFCVIGSIAMGFTWGKFSNMINEGKFSFDVGDIGDYDSLDIEFGYGKLEISYGDVNQVQIDQKNVKNYKCFVDERTLHIEGNLKSKIGIHNQDGKITIVIPNNMSFNEVDMELGAGRADVTGLVAKKMNIEIGAGEMNIKNLDTEKLDAETGAGKLYAELVGSETDYNYNLESGIGKLKIGENTYSGLGTEQNISNPNAKRFMDMECGVGEIEIKFQE